MEYTVQGRTYDDMSIVNQEIRKMFVDREVLANVTSFVNYVLDTGTDDNAPPFTVDDIECLDPFACPKCGAPSVHFVEHVLRMHEIHPEIDPEAPAEERYVCPICGTGYDNPDDARACCTGATVFKCEECGHIISESDYEDSVEPDYGAVENWYIVTDKLLQKLMDEGEIIIEHLNIWGCTTALNAISDDPAICDVCMEGHILEGQAHDWSKYLKR